MPDMAYKFRLMGGEHLFDLVDLRPQTTTPPYHSLLFQGARPGLRTPQPWPSALTTPSPIPPRTPQTSTSTLSSTRPAWVPSWAPPSTTRPPSPTRDHPPSPATAPPPSAPSTRPPRTMVCTTLTTRPAATRTSANQRSSPHQCRLLPRTRLSAKSGVTLPPSMPPLASAHAGARCSSSGPSRSSLLSSSSS
ncbi:hypothetical protein DAEQUDRAFT_343054 [Daedalea quercina L-15889]|uniref:Uncharacterized protein n=1 Tax=Daedalea quercina L-15889 TaxID=1314783 RepID=A0A165PG20_9APHY|nr:hypothetical protein DAEQUDRAFT_343054 [Daedalea quercina L-15889]